MIVIIQNLAVALIFLLQFSF